MPASTSRLLPRPPLRACRGPAGTWWRDSGRKTATPASRHAQGGEQVTLRICTMASAIGTPRPLRCGSGPRAHASSFGQEQSIVAGLERRGAASARADRSPSRPSRRHPCSHAIRSGDQHAGLHQRRPLIHGPSPPATDSTPSMMARSHGPRRPSSATMRGIAIARARGRSSDPVPAARISRAAACPRARRDAALGGLLVRLVHARRRRHRSRPA